VFAIENEMSTNERNLDANKYWTTIDGERYLQVQEVCARSLFFPFSLALVPCNCPTLSLRRHVR
jgi:hypothetical protein